MIVDAVQVVQNHEESLAWITAAEVAEGFADVQDPFATTKQATEAVGVHIIESQKLFGPLQTAVGRAHALGLLLPAQATPLIGFRSSGPHSSKRTTTNNLGPKTDD